MKGRRLYGLLILAVGVAALAVLWFVVGKTPRERAEDRIASFASGPTADPTRFKKEIDALGAEKQQVLGDLLASQRPEVSLATVRYIAESGDASAPDLLVEVLGSETTGWAAVRALGELEAVDAVPTMVDAVRQSSFGSPLREEAAIAFARIGAPTGISGLEWILEQDRPAPGTWIKQSALQENTSRIRALGSLARLAPEHDFLESHFFELEEYWNSPFGRLKLVVAEELAYFRTEPAEELLRNGLKDESPEVRAASLRSFAAHRPPDLDEVLAAAERDPASEVRDVAVALRRQ